MKRLKLTEKTQTTLILLVFAPFGGGKTEKLFTWQCHPAF
jgi:hypothetical protein